MGRINYLSAREETGQKIIKDLTGREAQLVCDPALLLTAEEWDEDTTPGRLIKENIFFVISWEIIFGKENLLKN